MTKHLHIVCHDVPYPADYGGVFDLFYKIKALHEQGIAIHLHCFEYGRGRQNELNKYCSSVNYYKRKNFLKGVPLRLPYIVSSRADVDLLHNLSKDNYPILLEGIHCTFFLYKNKLTNRKVTVRLHNVEYEYYEELAKTTKNIFKKIYFTIEGKLLKSYENNIANKAMFIAVSEKDQDTYIKKFHAANIEHIPVFLPYNKVTCEPGKGNFCIYHGNLSVAENEKAVFWLLENIFNTLEVSFVIAGKNPSTHLTAAVSRNDNVRLIANPLEEEMDELIKKAHVHILPSFNKTGVKIKLLNALFNGRFVIANDAAVEGTGVANFCEIANTPSEYKKLLVDLFTRSFSEDDILERKKALEKIYNNNTNAEHLMQLVL